MRIIGYLDIAYDQERLYDQPEPLLRTIVELSRAPGRSCGDDASAGETVAALEQRLLDAVGPERRDEALEVIETGRISWKLRDDDNLLVARLESQLPNVTPEPKPSTYIPIWAAKETSDQNITENAAANTKNMIAKARNLFCDLIEISPFIG